MLNRVAALQFRKRHHSLNRWLVKCSDLLRFWAFHQAVDLGQAFYRHISEDAVLRMIEAEGLPARRFGADWRIYKLALQARPGRPPLVCQPPGTDVRRDRGTGRVPHGLAAD